MKHSNNPVILHLLGNTGCGKTTLMDALIARNPSAITGISVGRELRKVYPPEYFQGQAAPTPTEQAALDLYRGFIETSVFHGYRLIIVDGQPRKASQVGVIAFYAYMFTENVAFVLLDTPHATRAARLLQRDSHDPAKMALAEARLNNDYRNQYECMIELAKRRKHLDICDTTCYTVETLVTQFYDTYYLRKE